MKIKNIQIPIMFFTLIFIPFISMSGSTETSMSQVEFPADITVISATFGIFVSNVSGETVNLHRITADWEETTVTWGNFGSSYDPTVIGSFVADSVGWAVVDVTDLVREWVRGDAENYGLLLEQNPLSDGTSYHSSEYISIEKSRPWLEICYESLPYPTCVSIERIEGIPFEVADSYIWEVNPTSNAGSSPTLYTGRVGGSGGQAGYEKQSLLRFGFTLEPPSDGEGCTPGYWKQSQHFDNWTSPYNNGLLFGSAGFEDAFPGKTLLNVVSTGGGGLKALGRHTVAALLNAASPDVAYPLTVSEVIASFNAGYPGDKNDYENLKDQFEGYNETFCPLN